MGPAAVGYRFARVSPEARRVVAATGLVAVLAGVAAQSPTFVLCGLVMATTAILMRWLSGDLALPAAVLTLVACATLAGLAADALGLNLLTWPWLLAALYLAFGALAVATTFRTRRVLLTRPSGAGRVGAAVAFLPAGLAAGVSLVQALDVRVPAYWAFFGTDVANHMLLLADVQRHGALDYAAQGYPRGLHMLMALVSVPGAPLSRPVAFLGYDLSLVAATTWLALAVVIWMGSSLVLRIGSVLGLGEVVGTLAAALLGAGMLLTVSFLIDFVYMGAAPSMVAVLGVWALPATALGLRTRAHRLVGLPLVAVTTAMLLAHLWQTLAVVPPVALAAYGLTRWPLAVRRLVPPSRPVAKAGAALTWLCVMLAAATPPFVGIVRHGGTSLAATPGHLFGLPWPLPVLGLLPLLALLGRWAEGWLRLVAGSVVGLLLATGVMLYGAHHGLDVTQYYPMKALWFLTIALAPLAALGAVTVCLWTARLVWRGLGRLGNASRLARFVACACAAAVAFAFWAPPVLDASEVTRASLRSGPPPPRSAHADVPRPAVYGPYGLAILYGTRFRPAVTVPIAVGRSLVFDPHGTRITSKIISFETGQPSNQGDPQHACSDVHAVAGSAPAVVVTKLDASLMHRALERQGCGGVRVVQIPGGIHESSFFQP